MYGTSIDQIIELNCPSDDIYYETHYSNVCHLVVKCSVIYFVKNIDDNFFITITFFFLSCVLLIIIIIPIWICIDTICR